MCVFARPVPSRRLVQLTRFLTIDDDAVKAMIPFHHGRQCLMRYIFRPDTPLRDYDRNDPKLREYAKMAMESAIVILRWSVESRIWMP